MKLRPGDRVQLKGETLDGHSGTVTFLDKEGYVGVRLDEGQKVGGWSAFKVRRSDIGRVER